MSFKDDLKGKTVTTTTIEKWDFEKALTDLLGLENMFEITDSPYDSHHKCNVDPEFDKKYFHDSDIEDVEECFRKGYASYYMLGNIMSWLHLKGHIEPGNYFVEISW